jgi:hypothetical protein
MNPPSRHCEEPTGPAEGRPEDRLRDEAIQGHVTMHCVTWPWIASLRSH